ncbi:MAG: DUF4976 domain-containing protein [Verrucomicrobia bacterium]|nr:DUF4976 domain-containing protein [Verrucomicrobiota bacterium]
MKNYQKPMVYEKCGLGSTGAIDKQTPAGWELHDLQKGPQEIHNVYGKPEYQAISKKLKLELLRLKEEFGDSDETYPELKKVLRSPGNSRRGQTLNPNILLALRQAGGRKPEGVKRKRLTEPQQLES